LSSGIFVVPKEDIRKSITVDKAIYPKVFFLLYFFIFHLFAFGQGDYQKGYVVTHTKDTIYGKVMDRKMGPFGGIYEKVRFKGPKRRHKFGPKDINAYKAGETYFKSLISDGELTFLKVKQEGYVSHYIYELQEQGEQLVLDIDYLQKSNNPQLIRVTQGVFGLRKKALISFFSDCPPLAKKILNKDFKYVFEVVDFYNQWVGEQSN